MNPHNQMLELQVGDIFEATSDDTADRDPEWQAWSKGDRFVVESFSIGEHELRSAVRVHMTRKYDGGYCGITRYMNEEFCNNFIPVKANK